MSSSIHTQFITGPHERRLLSTYALDQVPEKGEVVSLLADDFVGMVISTQWFISERSVTDAIVVLQEVKGE